MKKIILLLFLTFASTGVWAQAKPTSEADYNGTIRYAVSETNSTFPFVYKVVTERYENGKLFSTETEIDERQAEGIERETKTLVKDKKTTGSYSVMVGFGNHTYCSSDGSTWKGPQEFVCPDPEGSPLLQLNLPRKPEKTDYSVTDKLINGEKVKVYRQYSIFVPPKPNGKKEFQEEVATIDSRGHFVSVTRHEGTLNPEMTSVTTTETWDFKTKIKPVVAPK